MKKLFKLNKLIQSVFPKQNLSGQNAGFQEEIHLKILSPDVHKNAGE